MLQFLKSSVKLKKKSSNAKFKISNQGSTFYVNKNSLLYLLLPVFVKVGNFIIKAKISNTVLITKKYYITMQVMNLNLIQKFTGFEEDFTRFDLLYLFSIKAGQGGITFHDEQKHPH